MNDLSNNKFATITFWIGIVIAVATHIYMLVAGLPASQMAAHAILNLVAASLIIFAWTRR